MDGPFIFDDEPNIEMNSHIKLKSFSLNGLIDAGFKGPSNSRPVSKMSFALNYWLDGYETKGYHFINTLIHAFNGLLIAVFLRQTLFLNRQKGIVNRLIGVNDIILPMNGWLVPGLIGALWMMNPLQTQSVSYIVQRMNSLCTFFYLTAFIFYLMARRQKSSRIAAVNWGLCLLLGLGAIGSKEIAITLPFFIFLY
jgi:hypothetical protein